MTSSQIAFDVEHAAEAVCVSTDTIRREIRAGRLASRRSGKKILIGADELKEWFDALPSER
ncbi:helix-turn-helix domain-containing protein [Rhodococcus zopfii]|uniref:Helix-turn-helix domain-containing protein n=1 Tax=Rhodococcus zopfii TaxID=43772 RepID=A0ABU3WX39_9NOCA|nr:helix-turn-helix domain-containing protein [Rhodococcus zopfii]